MIRPATSAELTSLSELARRSKAHWGYSASFMAACRDELTVRETQLPLTFVKQLEQGVAGFYTLSKVDPARTELDFLFVEPWAMRRGYGLELLSHARSKSRHLGGRVMVIQGDPHAAAFYQAAGAIQIGERPSDSIPGRVLPLYTIAC
jgi:hypothetical protein